MSKIKPSGVSDLSKSYHNEKIADFRLCKCLCAANKEIFVRNHYQACVSDLPKTYNNINEKNSTE